MKVTTQAEYAVRALIHLVGQDKPVSVTTVSKKAGLSCDYVEQLFLKLRRGGLVESFRGVQGGYKLARNPERITIGAILSVVEGRAVFMAPCDQKFKFCKGQNNCRMNAIWNKIGIKVAAAFESVTLLDAWEHEIASRMTKAEKDKAVREWIGKTCR